MKQRVRATGLALAGLLLACSQGDGRSNEGAGGEAGGPASGAGGGADSGAGGAAGGGLAAGNGGNAIAGRGGMATAGGAGMTTAGAAGAGGAGDSGAPDSGDAATVTCDPSIGWTVPLEACSAARPCTNLLPTYSESELIEPAPVPADCDTGPFGTSRGRPVYGGDPRKSLVDADGVSRAYCEYRPPGVSSSSPRPLVLFVHPSGGSAQSVYDATSLRGKAPTFELSGSGGPPGFILVATQGRNLHWPTADPQDGAKHDTFHRDLGAPSGNRDVAWFDAIVDSLVAEGVADPNRIYLMGWSNGARFTAMYAIARRTTPTPGGNRVAAVANYDGGDPFENTQPSQDPSCKQSPYPQAAVPVLLITRTCDLIACDPAQAAGLGGVPPGNIASDWVAAMENQVGASPVDWRLIGDSAAPRASCALSCSPVRASLNHSRWPDGIQDGSGVDLEPDLLGFLRDHPLP